MSVRAQLDRQVGESRYTARRRLRLGSILADSGEEVLIHNLSVTGFLIETSADLTCGESLQVELPEGGPTSASVVWQRGGLYGCEFAVRVPGAVVSAAMLRNPTLPAQSQSGPEAAFAKGIAVEADEQDRYSLRTRILVILGLSAALWVLISFVVLSLV